MASRRRRAGPPDLRFEDEKLNRLMQHVRLLSQQVSELQDMLDGGTAGQVLTKTTSETYDATWQDP